MGANQSAPGSEARGGGAGSSNGADVKTCYYDLLGLERQATDEEIKKAYRRKALELHPDRNYGDVEKTTRLFAEIQAAYEVLSDPQERAWYDSHRDAILRHDAEGTGDHFEHNVRVTTAEDLMKMFTTFHGRMDFSDSSTGFFTVLRGTFDTLADEENVACDWEGAEPIDYPSFGHADDSYEDVVRPFYAAWGGFATKKTFAWKDAYHYSEAPDRRVRRRMEKENKRFREEGIREFNDAVRSLVAFVRKRDPRYVPNTQSEADRQKVIREAAAAQAARSRAANQAKLQGHVEPEWAKSQGPDELEGSIDEEEESEEEHFECVACGKTFKSEKQFEGHERSKKHIKMVQQLKRKMQKEDRAMKNSQAQDSAPVASESLDDSEMDMEHSELEDEEALFEDPSLSAPENSHTKEREQEEGSDELTNEADAEEQLTTSQQVKAESESSDPEESDDEYAPRETVESRILGKEKDALASGDDANPSREGHAEAENLVENFGETSIAGGIDSAGPRRAGKAREKRERKAAQQQQQQQQQMGATHKCAACDEQFSSKTKLFNHIKELGHAQPVPKAAKEQKGRKQ